MRSMSMISLEASIASHSNSALSRISPPLLLDPPHLPMTLAAHMFVLNILNTHLLRARAVDANAVGQLRVDSVLLCVATCGAPFAVCLYTMAWLVGRTLAWGSSGGCRGPGPTGKLLRRWLVVFWIIHVRANVGKSIASLVGRNIF